MDLLAQVFIVVVVQEVHFIVLIRIEIDFCATLVVLLHIHLTDSWRGQRLSHSTSIDVTLVHSSLRSRRIEAADSLSVSKRPGQVALRGSSRSETSGESLGWLITCCGAAVLHIALVGVEFESSNARCGSLFKTRIKALSESAGIWLLAISWLGSSFLWRASWTNLITVDTAVERATLAQGCRLVQSFDFSESSLEKAFNFEWDSAHDAPNVIINCLIDLC